MNSARWNDATALVVTALQIESDAIVSRLEDVGWTAHPSGSQYRTGNFAAPNGVWRVVVAEVGMGGETAASETARALDFFNPQIALFVGIAGGLKDVATGDVVVATEVHAF